MTTIPAHKPSLPSEHAHGHADIHRHEHAHEHPAHLAHHWDTPDQQFEAGKLGMWLFLATEVLLFGGLFCAYAVWRGNHPELFKYGSHFLNTTLGATNTAVLILSSLTMAWGVTAAQQNKQGLLKIMLILTLCGAATFLVIKYFEYKHKFDEGWYPGVKFYDVPPKNNESLFWHPEEPEAGASASEAMPGAAASAPNAAASAPATSTATQPSSTSANNNPTTATGGGFDLQTIAVSQPGASTKPGSASGTAGGTMPPADAPTFGPAATGPQGLNPKAPLVEEPFKFSARHSDAKIHPLKDPNRPINTHMFFNIYFMMTGLHGIHVFVGMIVISWLLIRAFRGDFSSEYFTPVDLGGLYWHIVDLIWIFLFPLFYLI